MKTKNIIDIYGKKCQIDEETKRLYAYSNKNKEIMYNAEIIENGNPTGFWAYYKVDGTVDRIDERLKVWNNKLILLYASSVDFNASKNDAEKEKYNKFVDFVKENQEKFFTKTGDFRKRFLICEKKIKDLI